MRCGAKASASTPAAKAHRCTRCAFTASPTSPSTAKCRPRSGRWSSSENGPTCPPPTNAAATSSGRGRESNQRTVVLSRRRRRAHRRLLRSRRVPAARAGQGDRRSQDHRRLTAYRVAEAARILEVHVASIDVSGAPVIELALAGVAEEDALLTIEAGAVKRGAAPAPAFRVAAHWADVLDLIEGFGSIDAALVDG